MLKHRKWWAGILAACLLAMPVAYAEDEPIQLEQQYETTSTDFHGDFSETTEVNGKKYKLKSVDYTVLKETPQTEMEEVVQTITYTDLYTKDAGAPSELVVQKGGVDVTLQLQGVDYTETVIQGRKTEVTGETLYGYQVSDPQPEAKKVVDYYDEQTGKTVSATLDYVRTETLDDWRWHDVDIPLEVTVYDAEAYQINDVLIPYNAEKPEFAGHEDEILKYLGRSTDKYRIVDVAWVGEPYMLGDVQHRRAVAHAQRYMSSQQAVYQGVANLPDAAGYSAVATYTGVAEIPTGEVLYQVRATATYTQDHTVAAIAAVVGLILLLLMVIVLLLVVFKKKKKSKDVEEVKKDG